MAGLWTLIRLILRRDRVKLPLWIGGFVLSLLTMIPLLRDIYGSEESLRTLYATFGANPAGLFMTGPVDAPTFGALITFETLLWWGVAIAFLNTLLIVRHTRHNEEIGAQELLLSGRLHRASSLVAALVVALGVNVLIVLGLGFGMSAISASWSSGQSWLFAVAMGTTGFAWAAISAVVVQLVESGRSANGILAGLIGTSFVVRGIGDFLGKVDAASIHQPHWASNLTPFGWLQATRPLTKSDWWPLLVSAVFALCVIALGFVLLAQRDVGTGLLPSRQGKRRASRFLSTPLGLTLYLQKNIFIGWLVAVLAMVGTIGLLVPQMTEVFDNADGMRRIIQSIGGTGALVPVFLSAMIAIVCLMIFAYAIHGLSKLRNEEASGRLESLLATRLSRLRWMGLHASVVFVGGVVMLAVTGLMLSVLTNALSELSVDVWEYTLAGLSYTPILVVFIALYLLLFGLLPRAVGGVTWLYFSFVAFTFWLGPIIELSQPIMNFSVMEHIATPPVEAIKATPLLVLSAFSSIAIVVGAIAWRHRNLQTG
ncbi:MAG TPA: hypothetical protein PKD68_00630 [Candidatus Saccharibacteria bacterium]|nr:hypothetical protein [Candidatus Saccharibacteria bacterium]